MTNPRTPGASHPQASSSHSSIALWPTALLTTFLGAGIFAATVDGSCLGALAWLLSLPIAAGILFLTVLPPVRWREIARTALWFLLPTLGRLAGEVVLDQQIAESIQRGNSIAEALERYRSQEGRFPERLDALAPKFLLEVPKTAMSGLLGTSGPDFGYSKADDDYQLWFRNRLRSSRRRSSGTTWRTRD